MNKQKTARLMLTVSMAIFGTLGLFVRHIGVSSGELALYRAVMAAYVRLQFSVSARNGSFLSPLSVPYPHVYESPMNSICLSLRPSA